MAFRIASATIDLSLTGIRGVGQALDRVRGRLNSIAGSVTRLGSLAAGALGGVGVAAAVKMAAAFEQTEIGFTTLLGSAEKARSLLGDLEAFAARTPFQFPDLANSAKMLLAMGFNAEAAVPMMRTLGDATSALGGGSELMNRLVRALGQMRAKGTVSGEEMRQLAEAGIPAWEMLASAIGKTVPEAMKLSEQRAISASTGITAVMEGMQKRFVGATRAQSQTTAGLFSTLKDNVGFAMRDIGASIIEGFNLNQVMKNITSFVQQLQPIWSHIVKIAVFVGQGVFDVFKTMWDGVKSILSVFGIDMTGTFQGFMDSLKIVAVAIKNWKLSAQIGFLSAVKAAIDFATRSVEVVKWSFSAMGQIGKNLFHNFKATFQSIFEIVKQVFMNIVNVVKNAFRILKDVVTGKFKGDFLLEITRDTTDVIPEIEKLFRKLTEGVEGIPEFVPTEVSKALQNTIEGMRTQLNQKIEQDLKDIGFGERIELKAPTLSTESIDTNIKVPIAEALASSFEGMDEGIRKRKKEGKDAGFRMVGAADVFARIQESLALREDKMVDKQNKEANTKTADNTKRIADSIEGMILQSQAAFA